ncbi:CPBP family glutamic-type intramembrane protease [Parerythrobacter lacustris]|uniref:CPBP family glutamic-type intramembrane protease n=1 Tax=Parerythrobacter lacustris TaxID=2969984 RepID=A0ABT1XR69_9SPHN|nr:CPBP family glutamic-type intramembrane protease [Parerythrobacter lacustris]MCR2834154.1 CPBP family glutamic-type intramembrane protease [Parerythrobacter lacustris]
MNGVTTTPEAAPAPHPETPSGRTIPAAGSVRGEWRRYFAFLRRPALPDKAAPVSGATLAATLRLYTLDLLLVGTLLSLALMAVAAGFVPPDNALAELEFNALTLFAIVVFAPVLEEIGFRGWLSGRAGAVLPILLLGAGFTAVMLAGQSNAMLGAGLFLLAAMAALVLAIVLRKRPAWTWFQRFFPLFFWLSTVAFALVHIFNYTEGSFLALLPLVLPQFIAGSIFGYARVNYGLWSAMLLHILHNGTLIGLVLLAINTAGG